MKCVTIGLGLQTKLSTEYLSRMEDVLDLYNRPLNPEEPVVCLDEKPVQLLADVREPLRMGLGKFKRRDNEYVRLV